MANRGGGAGGGRQNLDPLGGSHRKRHVSTMRWGFIVFTLYLLRPLRTQRFKCGIAFARVGGKQA